MADGHSWHGVLRRLVKHSQEWGVVPQRVGPTPLDVSKFRWSKHQTFQESRADPVSFALDQVHGALHRVVAHKEHRLFLRAAHAIRARAPDSPGAAAEVQAAALHEAIDLLNTVNTRWPPPPAWAQYVPYPQRPDDTHLMRQPPSVSR